MCFGNDWKSIRFVKKYNGYMCTSAHITLLAAIPSISRKINYFVETFCGRNGI